MTNYDRLIDTIKQELYEYWTDTALWDESKANKTSHKILQHVEEFQNLRSKINE